MLNILKKTPFLASTLWAGAALVALCAIARADDNALPVETESVPALDKSKEWMLDPNMYMVAIEALVVEVSEDKTRDLGLHYGYAADGGGVVQGSDVVMGRPLGLVAVPSFTGDLETGITKTGFSPRLPGLGVNLTGMNVNGGVLSARLRTLLDDGEARISTRPIVMALNGTDTMIWVGTRVPYQDVNSYGYPELAEGEVGVKLEVRPMITDLNKQIVELNINNVEVSSLSSIINNQNIQQPVFTKSDTRTKITMTAGETYQLSSLKGRKTVEKREGIPVLMHIPLLGKLFSSLEQREESIDILFFITPHIVQPGQNILVPYDFKNRADLASEGVDLGSN